jgi:hypothetical protein
VIAGGAACNTFFQKIGKSVARNDYLPIFAASNARRKAKTNRNSDFFHNLYIVFPLLFPHQEGFFVTFEEINYFGFGFSL